MTKDERRKAEFFAKLASIPNWKKIQASDRGLLEEEAEQLFPWLKPDLDFLYGKTRDWLGGLLDGEVVRPEPPVAWVLREGEFLQEMLFKTQVPGREHITDLMRLFRERPFPFCRCQTCEKVFVPAKRTTHQKYCSRGCALQAYAQDEQKKEQRKQYIRDYMAERRAKEKEKELAKLTKRDLARERAGKLPAGEKAFAKHLKSLPLSPWKTDEGRRAYQQAEQQRLREEYEKRRTEKQPPKARQGRKEK